MSRARLLAGCVLAALVAGCGQLEIERESVDSGSPSAVDAGREASAGPGGQADSGPMDAGELDAGWTPDGGSPADAGAPFDAGLTIEEQTLALVNQWRAQGANCAGTAFGPTGPLVINSALHDSAQEHSDDMASNNYFAHDSLDGGSPFQRMEAAGFTGFTMGENIAAGYADPSGVVQAWMSDYPHCANIMNPAFTQTGIGYGESPTSTYGEYWTEDFGG